jgi:hypothetical protein
MAKTIKRRIRWNASNSLDVLSHKVYWVVGGGEIDYASTNFREFPSNVTQAIIPDDIPELGGVDDDVTIGVTAVDDIGNESDITAVTVPLDFLAPSAPTGLVVETI